MATSNSRLPARRQLLPILTAIVIPIHIWVLFRVMTSIPQWILRSDQWELIGIISYSLMFALLETLLVFLFVLLLIGLVSRQRLDPILIPVVAVFATLTTALMVVLLIIPLQDILFLILALVVYILLLVASYILVRRNKTIAGLINSIIDRLIPLAVLYIMFDVLAAFIVVIRNLFA